MSLSNFSFSGIWQRPAAWRCPDALWLFGVATLLLYAGLRILWPTLGSTAETLSALLGLVAVLVYGHKLRSSGPLWLLLAALMVQSLSWWFGYQDHPDWVESNPQLDRLAKLFIFIAVAWWLGGSTRNTVWLWGLAAITYVAATLVHGGLQEWWDGLAGQRVGFGIRNNQHGSMMYGVVLLGLVVLAPRIMQHGRWRWIRRLGWLCLTLISLIAVLIGQTRAVWLALSLTLPLALMVWLIYQWWQKGGISLRIFAVASLASLILAGTAITTLHEPLTSRIFNESEVIEALANGEFEDVPYTSIGIRINTWRAAAEWVSERPLVGWGGKGRSLVIEHTEWLPEFVKENFGHLHNFFLEIWVAYGLLGLAVIFALALWIGHGCWRSWRAGVLPGDLALFGAAFFIYWIVVNQFESYNSFWTGVYIHNLVVGGLVTHIWRWQLEQVAEQEQELAAGKETS
ncbi:MAG: O-antigen ligase family protein [Halomonas sp.]|uniref:O-antigen ligase family protein n=1 Tax=Halomonas sp. TaxID=1486246 RepID=UPI003F8DF4D5